MVRYLFKISAQAKALLWDTDSTSYGGSNRVQIERTPFGHKYLKYIVTTISCTMQVGSRSSLCNARSFDGAIDQPAKRVSGELYCRRLGGRGGVMKPPPVVIRVCLVGLSDFKLKAAVPGEIGVKGFDEHPCHLRIHPLFFSDASISDRSIEVEPLPRHPIWGSYHNHRPGICVWVRLDWCHHRRCQYHQG